MSDFSTLYQKLITTNRDAFELRLYNVAYYALVGSLHCARALQNRSLIEEVEKIAMLQKSVIEGLPNLSEKDAHCEKLYVHLLQQTLWMKMLLEHESGLQISPQPSEQIADEPIHNTVNELTPTPTDETECTNCETPLPGSTKFIGE